MVADPQSFLSQRADVVAVLRSFFAALTRQDWQTVQASFHPTASLFSFDPGSNLSAASPWKLKAPALKRWLEEAGGIHRPNVQVDDLEVKATDKTAIVTLPSSRRVAGARLMILTLDEGRWLVRHLNLSRLGIELPALEAEP